MCSSFHSVSCVLSLSASVCLYFAHSVLMPSNHLLLSLPVVATGASRFPSAYHRLLFPVCSSLLFLPSFRFFCWFWLTQLLRESRYDAFLLPVKPPSTQHSFIRVYSLCSLCLVMSPLYLSLSRPAVPCCLCRPLLCYNRDAISLPWAFHFNSCAASLTLNIYTPTDINVYICIHSLYVRMLPLHMPDPSVFSDCMWFFRRSAYRVVCAPWKWSLAGRRRRRGPVGVSRDAYLRGHRKARSAATGFAASQQRQPERQQQSSHCLSA